MPGFWSLVPGRLIVRVNLSNVSVFIDALHRFDFVWKNTDHDSFGPAIRARFPTKTTSRVFLNREPNRKLTPLAVSPWLSYAHHVHCDRKTATPRTAVLHFDSQQFMSKYVTACVLRSQTPVWQDCAAVTRRDISLLMIKSARTPIVRSSPRRSAGSGPELQRR